MGAAGRLAGPAKWGISDGSGGAASGLADGSGQWAGVDGLYAGGGLTHYYLAAAGVAGAGLEQWGAVFVASAVRGVGGGVAGLHSGLQTAAAVDTGCLLSTGLDRCGGMAVGLGRAGYRGGGPAAGGLPPAGAAR